MLYPVNLIIFDLDGTLIDSLPDLADATNHMLSSLGRPSIGQNAVRRLVGQGARRLVERALAGASEDEINQGLDLFLDYNHRHIADRTVLYLGVPETLDALKGRGMRMAIISNKNVALCREVVSVLGIDRYFDEVLGADSLPFRKPSPEPVLKLLADFGVPPERAALVGDSINDMAAAKGARVSTVGCTWGYGELTELADADYLVESFGELFGIPLFCGGEVSI
ncbi:HAD-superfamily hydrolase, subfamily IA, variant 1 [Geobacter metallireducens RCH3]|uniref:phosphoglycolate phosphatase n=1 Tax=Geobacter metallireducens (strain ATCC 53774 / DSM 7210 / GS-15) TaxID=269799 RepID=Q39TA9_GEOMG|nr:HAD-IA family hydrolase [Geobacter metallireducens]ABB32515.1 HAD superfamily hydrolase [Geobacter metallireducens GS-15]EHP84362.1 HAD-superfamily hydrolase, subfamily IA, variant 1 [Geobacter metallireducens RCH3]MBT1076040.1 HAD-IA family hydrolase [Geobacter grbiciae]